MVIISMDTFIISGFSPSCEHAAHEPKNRAVGMSTRGDLCLLINEAVIHRLHLAKCTGGPIARLLVRIASQVSTFWDSSWMKTLHLIARLYVTILFIRSRKWQTVHIQQLGDTFMMHDESK